jgi:hypothetical protein
MKNGAPIILTSPLSPAECERRIEEAAEPYRLFRLWQPRTDTVTAEPIDFGYRLRVHHPQLPNSFAPILNTRLTASRSGTYIEACAGMDRDVKAFMVVWFLFLSLMGGIVTVVFFVQLLTGQLEAGGDETVGMIGIVALAIFGILLVVVGQRINANDEGRMLAFLTQLLHATETDAAEPVSLPWQ